MTALPMNLCAEREVNASFPRNFAHLITGLINRARGDIKRGAKAGEKVNVSMRMIFVMANMIAWIDRMKVIATY